MKTPPLKRDESGQYPGSLGYTESLSATEQRGVQEALCEDSPLHLSSIAQKAAIPMTNPAKTQALRTYLEVTLQQSGDAEMAFQDRSPTVTGRERSGKEFLGWRGTAQLKETLEKKGVKPKPDGATE